MTSAPVHPDLLGRGGVDLRLGGGRATITLCRPETLNAQDPHTWDALTAIGRALPDEVRVVVVRGAGRAFSAGLDRRLFTAAEYDGGPSLATLGARPAAEVDALIAGWQAGFSWLRRPERVSVAAVQGHAVGAGFQLALACDLRLVADDARLRRAEPALGLVPDLGGTHPLVHAVGHQRAVEICLTGRAVGAEEAVRIGLALRAVPPAELDTAVDELVTAVLAVPRDAATETLALLTGVAEGADPAAALAAERAAQYRRLRSLADPRGR